MNKRIQIVTNVLWVVAIVCMVGVMIAARELRREVKDIKRELILHRK